jgi:methyl-accepting chemotaxis protein
MKMLKNIKIGPKLMGSFLVVALILAAVATIGYINLRTISARGNDLYNLNAKEVINMSLINGALEKMRGDIYRYIAVAAERNSIERAINEQIAIVNELIKEYKNRELNAEEKSILTDFDVAWPEMQRGYIALMRSADENNMQQTERLLADDSYVIEARKKTLAAVKNLSDYNMNGAEIANKANIAAAQNASTAVLVFTVLGFLAAVLLGLILTISLTGPLDKAVKMMQGLALGHISDRVQLDRKDEIGILAAAMDDFAEKLQKYVVKGMEEISEGNINIATPMMDDKDEIGPVIKRMVVTIGSLISEMEFLTKSTIEGKLNKRANQDAFKGAYKEIVSGINTSIDTLVSYIDRMPGVVMLLDTEFNIQYMNETGVKLLKANKDQIIGSKCYSHFKTGDCNTGKCACGRAMAEGRAVTSETEAHPGGSNLDISYTGVPIKDRSGKTIGAFEVVTDQTDIKRAQRLSQKISDYQSVAVEKISRALESISKGEFNVDVDVDKGDNDTVQVRENFVVITKAIMQTVSAVKQMTDDINTLTQAAVDGNLAARAEYKKHKGEYSRIVEGINNILDGVIIPINEAADVLEKVSSKDLAARVKGNYKGDLAKIKEALNLAVDNLDKAMQQVAIGAEQVASASVQVSTGAQSLSQGTSEQASSLEEVSSSLQEMSSMTKQNVSNAKEAKGVAELARESADKGVESMSKLSSAINKIKASSDSTAKIVKTIDEIAFQTNLLALNAAVEAARAGDAGKGFAVVAEEVRNLAMRSAEAAKNTANLIEEAVKNSENGVVLNSEVLKNFQEINEKANKVSQVVAEIAAASEQQDQGISQVNKAVEQMNQVTQQNAANAEESASAAEEMSSQSEEMRSMVAGFKLTASNEFSQALKASSQSGHLLHNLAQGKKGVKAAAGIQPDPRKVIPLDEKDHKILKDF